MRRGFANARTFYRKAWDDECGERYVDPTGESVIRCNEGKWDDHYRRVHNGLTFACVAAGFAWGFSEDKNDSAFMSIAGMIGGLLSSNVVVPVCFIFPELAGVAGLFLAAKGAAKARHWYKQTHKRD
jgi:hypothetical protein